MTEASPSHDAQETGWVSLRRRGAAAGAAETRWPTPPACAGREGVALTWVNRGLLAAHGKEDQPFSRCAGEGLIRTARQDMTEASPSPAAQEKGWFSLRRRRLVFGWCGGAGM